MSDAVDAGPDAGSRAFGPDLAEVFGPAQQVGGPELVQLLTPEGERVEHPEFRFAPPGDEAETIRGLYRDMVSMRRTSTMSR